MIHKEDGMGSRLLIVVVALVAVATLLLSTMAPVIRGLRSQDLAPAARSAQRRSALASLVAGIAALVALGFWVDQPAERSALALATAPALVGAVVVLVASVAERTWPQPRGAVRTAVLRTGRPGSRSTWLFRATVVASILTVAIAVVGIMTAAPDGQSARLQWPTGGAGHSPYPGSHYAVPIIGALVLLTALTTVGLREVDSRPALGPGLAAVDDAAREASRVRVLRGAAFGALASASGLSLTMGAAWVNLLGTARSNAPDGAFDGPAWAAVHTLSVGLCFVAAAAGALAIWVFVTPGPRMPSPDGDEPASGPPHGGLTPATPGGGA
jgi:hypothetical protein